MTAPVVYLTPEIIEELAAVTREAAGGAHTMRVWIDGGGFKYSVSGSSWSPPLGTTKNPLDLDEARRLSENVVREVWDEDCQECGHEWSQHFDFRGLTNFDPVTGCKGISGCGCPGFVAGGGV